MTAEEATPVTDEQLEEIVEFALGWYPVGSTNSIDWEDLLHRIEKSFGIELPGEYLDPEIKRIQRAIRNGRKEK